MTRILLTNDDGIQSPGLAVLRRALDPLGEVVIYAPGDNQSAVARGITTDRALRASARPSATASRATPSTARRSTACASPCWACGPAAGLVVAGVNLGGNMGDDVTYSGTVGAALEAALRGLPAVAVSVESSSPGHLERPRGCCDASSPWRSSGGCRPGRHSTSTCPTGRRARCAASASHASAAPAATTASSWPARTAVAASSA